MDWLSARHSFAEGQLESLGEDLQLAETETARNRLAKIA